MSTSPVLALAQQLINCPSVTPEDHGCQAILVDRLQPLGFNVLPLPFSGVPNFWATRGQAASPCVVFSGHTDVVPAGPLSQWDSPPFQAEVRDNCLYGRGAADMKGALAAMLCATEQFIHANPDYPGTIGFLITGDEEGPALHGTRAMMAHLKTQGVRMDYCVVGEPSSSQVVGDALKVGRRGSLTGRFQIHGKQGHIAYPHRAHNPIHQALAALQALVAENWDREPNPHFPPTSFQLSQIDAGAGAINVIPGHLHGAFNFRFSNTVSPDALKQRVAALFENHGCRFDIQWELSGLPFLTQGGRLIEACQTAVFEIQGITPLLSTDGGTSDGRFIAPEGIEVVELGLCNHSIHALNEHAPVADLEHLQAIYRRVLETLLGR